MLDSKALISELKMCGFNDATILDAIRNVPREKFVPSEIIGASYRNTPLSIGYEQTISQPLVVAEMTHMLNLSKDTKALEIGTGSGYQAAVLAQLCDEIYSIERIQPLVAFAKRNLKDAGITNVVVKHDDGTLGWPEHAPFDRIIITADCAAFPHILFKQLTIYGIMVFPMGCDDGSVLVKIIKTNETSYTAQMGMQVRFVPLLRGIIPVPS